ncbi:MAG: hypothetical protein ACKO2H_10015, partial [Bacteroidota bacterium]
MLIVAAISNESDKFVRYIRIKYMSNQELPILYLLPNAHGRVRSGHPWIYAESLQKHEPLSPGSIVRIMTDYGYDCGIGL